MPRLERPPANGVSEKKCCGDYRNNGLIFPFDTLNGNRDCCGSKTFDVQTKQCCDSSDSVVKARGACSRII